MADVTYLGRSFTSNTVYTTTYSQVTTVRQTGWEWRPLTMTAYRYVWRSYQARDIYGRMRTYWAWTRVPYSWSVWIYGIWRVTENKTITTVIATVYTTATDSYESLLKTIDIPYIRQKTIYFVCEGLRPYTRHHVYFDGTNVDQYVARIVGAVKQAIPNSAYGILGRYGQSYTYTKPGVDDQPLMTDATGYCSGYFYLPPGIFKTGERIFKVTDAATDDGDWTSIAFTQYTARGKLETRQQTNITSLYSVNSSVVSQSATVNSSSAQLLVAFPWGDPIAQTFRVENQGQSIGAFITGVEVWVQSKDSTIPLTMQIRDTDNGYPGQQILRSVTMNPADINVGLNKTTFFRLDVPLYIENMKDYAIVFMANSQKYNLYICTLGQNQMIYDPDNLTRSNVFSTPNAVAKQPYLGSFFMSQNGTTWTADQMSDLAFRIYRANFLPTADVYFHAKNPAMVPVGGPILHTTAGSPNVYIEFADHGFGIDHSVTPTWHSYVELVSQDLAAAGLVSANLTGTRQIISVDEYGFTVAAGANATLTGVWDIGYLEVNKNCKTDVLHPICGAEVLAGTDIAYSYKATTGQSIGGTQQMYVKDANWKTFTPNQDLTFDEPRLIASLANEATTMAGAHSYEQKITLSTTNPLVSPIVDLSKVGLTSISHIMNNPTNDNETSVSEGLALTRYISKSVTLENPATALRVIVAGNVITGNSIDVYYRFVSPENNVPISTLEWTPLPGNTSKKASVRDEFIDYTFEDTGITPFTTYQIKIVLKGINSAIPPIIKDVRTLALAV